MDIIEVALDNVTEELLTETQALGVRTMIYHQENDPTAFERIIDLGVEMVNLNHADSFIKVRDKRA